ncbi:MAG: DUF4438 domain-containing protein [Mariprofundales bacterium]
MLKTNSKELVIMGVQGGIAPAHQWAPFEVGSQGEIFAWPSTGGISYNVKAGDSVFGWAGDHIEPSVSATCTHNNKKVQAGFQFLPCCGNQARIINGDAKGQTGTVLGHHGGVEHLIIDFHDHTLDRLNYDSKLMIRAIGQGLRLLEYPDVYLYNLDPNLLAEWGIKQLDNGHLQIPVTTIIPAHLMGSGIGSLSVTSGDYDILCHDADSVAKHNMQKLRFGDFVAIMDHDNRYGRTYRKGAVTIGIVIHSDSPLAGHGPGMTTLMSACDGILEPVLNQDANIACMRKIGRFT